MSHASGVVLLSTVNTVSRLGSRDMQSVRYILPAPTFAPEVSTVIQSSITPTPLSKQFAKHACMEIGTLLHHINAVNVGRVAGKE